MAERLDLIIDLLSMRERYALKNISHMVKSSVITEFDILVIRRFQT